MAQFDQFSAAAAVSRDSSSRGNLAGKLCVVGDGTTTVGSGIVRQLLAEGATVVAPLRHEDQIERLHQDCAGTSLDALFPVIVDMSTPDGGQYFVEGLLEKHGCVDHAISVWGSFWCCGLLTDQPLSEYEAVMAERATPHFLFAKCLLPAMKHSPSSSFLFITEGAGKRAISAESSLYTVAASAVYGIVLAAQVQYAEDPFRINEMRLFTMFKRHTDIGSLNYQDFYGMKAYSNRKVGRLAVDALKASKHRERIVVTPERLDGEALMV